MAEQIASSMHKGDKVIALGKLIAESYKDKDGNDRTTTRLDLESIGLDLSRVPKNSYSNVEKVSDDVYEFADKLDEDSPF
jgi:single-stranded DNA-binding protein